MAISEKLSKLSPAIGEYYLIERSQVDSFYREAGYKEDDENMPNYLKIDGKECLFTENFVEKDGKEYEIVMVANGFNWGDVLLLDDDEDADEDDEEHDDAKR